jgi:hypothetical protein
VPDDPIRASVEPEIDRHPFASRNIPSAVERHIDSAVSDPERLARSSMKQERSAPRIQSFES